MKKLVVFMLVALFLLGSFPMAFAEEPEAHEHDGCCEMLAVSGEIVPYAPCRHSDFPYNTVYRIVRSYCTMYPRYYMICTNCGEEYDYYSAGASYEDHLGPYTYVSAGVDADGNPIYHKLCERCNSYV